MRNKNKNIYVGLNSTAQIPVNNKVDTAKEIMLNAFATSYDALNNIMLTKRSGFFDKTTIQEINGRFGIIRMLCLKHCPSYISDVDAMYKIISEHYKNNISDVEALGSLRNICLKYNLNPSTIDNAINRINQAENNFPEFNNLNQIFPFWIQSQKPGVKRNKNYNRRVLF